MSKLKAKHLWSESSIGALHSARVHIGTIFRDVMDNGLIASGVIPIQVRWRLLRLRGYSIDRCLVAPSVFFGGKDIKIGRNSFVNYLSFIDGIGGVDIGRNVRIGMQVTIVTGSHSFGPSEMRAGAGTSAPVRIEDGVWVGARAIILPGVTVGKGAVIAAGAVVSRDCNADTLYAGIPARMVRLLGPEERGGVTHSV